MNKNERFSRGHTHPSQLSQQLLFQYVLALVGFMAGVLLLAFVSRQIFSMFIWYDTDPLYWVLQFIKKYIVVFVSAISLAGWTLITYRFMSKPLYYLDEIITAAKRLAQHTDEPIVLPEAMLDTQNELNLVREKALRDAATAKEAEQRKNDLIVYLAHDLKTPLTSVIGYLTLLRDEPQISPEFKAKYTGIALDKALRLEDLINEFFDITRFNLTSLTLDEETINLTRMLEQITFEFNPVLAEKELAWETQLAPNVHLVCDPDKLERVFNNLLRNAISYSYPRTSILVSMEQNKDYVTIQVQNHGKTIPPEKLGRIFEQFFRLDSSRSTATGQAGLGLAIAKEIVELHGGTITAESADESIIFTVTFPLFRKKIV